MRTLAIAALAVAGSVQAAEIRIIDGDGLVVDGETIRLFGIDAPEAGQRCNSPDGGTWRCGQEAIETITNIVSRAATFSCQGLGFDEFGRTLGACYADGQNVARSMVEAGMAWSFRRYSDTYDDLEDEIRPSGVGIWQADTQTPWDFRAQRWDVVAQEAPEGCPIKGNINGDGDRIYHTPWSHWYDRTAINEADGERWFCDEGEAIEAGWRAPLWGG